MNAIETITLICGIILCIVGVLTFFSGRVAKAKQDGILEEKVDSALKGIEEIKESLNKQNDWREVAVKTLQSHDEQIVTLFKKCEKLEQKVETLDEFKRH